MLIQSKSIYLFKNSFKVQAYKLEPHFDFEILIGFNALEPFDF